MKLFDLLGLHDAQLEPSATKVHLAAFNGQDEPIAVWRRGDFEVWQRWQFQRVFERPYIVSLVRIPARNDRWLFAGAYKVLGCRPHPEHEGNWLYDTQEVEATRPLTGRLVVAHHRTGRNSFRLAETFCDTLTVAEIREAPMLLEPFSTYSEVRLSKAELDLIVRAGEPSWRAALAAIAGIYLITDTSNGRLYVGSATGDTRAVGEGGIWSRWCEYSRNGHGGNVELKRLLSPAPAGEGPEHARHFQYAILEVADTHTSELDLLRRESHWKQVLQSGRFGYNGN